MSSLAPLHRSDTDLSAAGLGAALARAVAPARLAAAGLLVVFVGLLALPLQAQAQTVETLVSNTGQTVSTSTAYVGPLTPNVFRAAQGFRTGDNASGYTLSSVDLRLGSVDTGAVVTVSIYDASASGHPNDSLYVLTNPVSIVSAEVNTFTAPANATLVTATEYLVVVEASVEDNPCCHGRHKRS